MGFCYFMISMFPETESSHAIGNNNDLPFTATQITSITEAKEMESNGINPRDYKKKLNVKLRVTSERRRVTITCAALVILFIVCWLPFHAVHMAKIKGIFITWNEVILNSNLNYFKHIINIFHSDKHLQTVTCRVVTFGLWKCGLKSLFL